MLPITIPYQRLWDEKKEEFVYIKETKLQLEHSLISLSKWESKWCKPFFSKRPKTDEETLDYIKCMTLTQNVDPEVYKYIPDKVLDEVLEYIEAPMSALRFLDDKSSTGKELITYEVIYNWMFQHNVPFECRKWHLNQLLSLLRYCNSKNTKQKPRSQAEIWKDFAEINKRNREKYNSKG